MTEDQWVVDTSPEPSECDTYGHEWRHADCEECGSPECYVYCDCGEEEYQQCGGPE